MTVCKELTIFEGPDGSGKTTAAKAYAEHTGAIYVHFPALPQVSNGLARMYVEAMLPALLGHQAVVFDRCWMSEMPYGAVFREGQDRLGRISIRMLERLAMRCGAVIVKCLPNLDTVLKTYESRQHIEMLDNSYQVMDVYQLYQRAKTDLPVIPYDYQSGPLSYGAVDYTRMTRHRLKIRSAGNLEGLIALVGDSFANRKNEDPFYQWPFASFSRQGCSQWLTYKLEMAKIREDDLFWVNADQPLDEVNFSKFKYIIALGNRAKLALNALDINAELVNHPQHHKRFGVNASYRLIEILEKAA